MDGDKKIVPKFTSFTAKKPTPRTQSRGLELEARGLQGKDDPARRRKPRSSSQYGGGEITGQSTRPERIVDINTEPQSLGDPGVEASDSAFIIDTKGDVDNLKYGGANQWKIPKYARAGSSRVLGTEFRIDSRVVGETGITLRRPGDSTDSVRPILGRKHLRFPQPRRLKPSSASDATFGNNNDVVSLTLQKSAEPTFELGSIELVRDISLDKSRADEDNDPTSEDDIDDFSSDRTIIQRNAELNRAVRSEPSTVKHWLELANFQAQMVLTDSEKSVAGVLNAAEKRKLAEIRIPIYQDALKLTKPDSDGRQLLWLGLLSEAHYSYDSESQARKWQQALEDCGESGQIRLAKLNFVQRNYLKYGLEVCKQEYLQMLAFSKAQFAATSEHGERQNISLAHTYVLLRYTVFLQQSGYHELAFALWQSALDYVLFPLTALEEPVQSYADFWDSEAARLGEVVKGGWSVYKPGDSIFESNLSADLEIANATLRPQGFSRVAALAVREKVLMSRSCLPGRITDMDDDIDAFHVVLSSDITPFLECLVTDAEVRPMFMAAFICFVGLPKPCPVPQGCETWWSDSWTASSSVPSLAKDISPSSLRWFFFPVFTSEMVAFLLQESQTLKRKNASIHRYDIIIRILRSFNDAPGTRSIQITIITAILKWKGIDAAAKEAKKLLKADSANIAMYQALFAIENFRGNDQLAERIISTPLRMRQSFSKEIQDQLVQLWRTWIWNHLSKDNALRVTQLLLSLDTLGTLDESLDKVQLQAANVLKSEHWIEGAISQALHHQNADNIVPAIELGMLLAYIKSSKSLASALQYLKVKVKLLPTSHPFHKRMLERLHQGRTDIVAYHAKNVRPYRPSEVQALLQESIQLFPTDSVFLEEYANQQLTFSLDDRLLGAMMVTSNAECDSLNRWLTSIWLEYRRCKANSISQHSTRAIYERAVESQSGELSSSLWASYMNFEKNHGTVAQFQNVLNRALTKLPWVKDFVLEGLIHLDGKVSDDRLRQLYALLEERDIRMISRLE